MSHYDSFDGPFGKNDGPRKPKYPLYSKMYTGFEYFMYGAQPKMKSELLYHSLFFHKMVRTHPRNIPALTFGNIQNIITHG